MGLRGVDLGPTGVDVGPWGVDLAPLLKPVWIAKFGNPGACPLLARPPCSDRSGLPNLAIQAPGGVDLDPWGVDLGPRGIDMGPRGVDLGPWGVDLGAVLTWA